MQDRSGTGSARLLAGALRGLSYTRESDEEEEEEETAGVFESSLLSPASFSPSRRLQAA